MRGNLIATVCAALVRAPIQWQTTEHRETWTTCTLPPEFWQLAQFNFRRAL